MCLLMLHIAGVCVMPGTSRLPLALLFVSLLVLQSMVLFYGVGLWFWLSSESEHSGFTVIGGKSLLVLDILLTASVVSWVRLFMRLLHSQHVGLTSLLDMWRPLGHRYSRRGIVHTSFIHGVYTGL